MPRQLLAKPFTKGAKSEKKKGSETTLPKRPPTAYEQMSKGSKKKKK